MKQPKYLLYGEWLDSYWNKFNYDEDDIYCLCPWCQNSFNARCPRCSNSGFVSKSSVVYDELLQQDKDKWKRYNEQFNRESPCETE